MISRNCFTSIFPKPSSSAKLEKNNVTGCTYVCLSSCEEVVWTHLPATLRADRGEVRIIFTARAKKKQILSSEVTL